MTSNILKSISKSDDLEKPKNKITVIGVGSVGMAAAFACMDIAGELALIDVEADKVRGEVLDLQQGQQFLRRCTVRGGTDYKESAGSDIVVITAGARQNEGESRLNLVQRNVDILRHIVPNVVKHSPHCIIVIVSNPVDVLTYVTMKLSGFSPNRVIGTGTMLDSARFRYMLGQKLGVAANCVHGYVIGEHGDSSVPIWSQLNVGGVCLSKKNPKIGQDDDPEKFGLIHKEVVQSAYDIIRLKGYTSWAIGLTVRSLCNAILHNLYAVFPLSVYTKDVDGAPVNGIPYDICISLPALVNNAGVCQVIEQDLSEVEREKLMHSAKTMDETLKGLKL